MSVDPVSSRVPVNRSSDPAAIRAELTPDVAATFDAEWESTLEAAKRTQDLQEVHDLLTRWRFVAAAEQASPGRYARALEAAERIQSAGSAEAAGYSTYDARAVLNERLRDADRSG
jgi:hypothetical protein